MYDYDLDGKQVILVLDPDVIDQLKHLGIPGSPVYGKVFKAVEAGLWMDNHYFPLCPIDQPKLVHPSGEAFCHAHIFIPAPAIISLAVFPNTIKEPDQAGLNRIGFKPL
jgi:hypothetical protein